MNNIRQQIISINIDGNHANLFKLEEIIRANQPLACLLQDIPGSSRDQLIDTCKAIAKDYELTINPVQFEGRKSIDNLILTNREWIQIKEVHAYRRDSNAKASALGVSIFRVTEEGKEERDTMDHGRLTIFSIYIRPKATYNDTKACLDWILDSSKKAYGHSRTIIMGDMNASEPTWCPIEEYSNNRENSTKHYRQIKSTRGRLIAKQFNKMRLTCLNRINQGPTYTSKQGSSYIDLAFIGNKAIRTWQTLSLKQLWEPPGHKVLVLEAKGPIQLKLRRKTYKRIKLESLNEQLFEEAHIQGDSLCINWKHLPRNRIIRRIDRLTSVLYKALHIAQTKITTRVTRRLPARGSNKGVLNPRVRRQLYKLQRQQSLIAKLRHKLKGIRSNNLAQAASRQNLQYRKTVLKRKIARLRRDIVLSMNTTSLFDQHDGINESDLWKRVRLCLNQINRETEYSASENNAPLRLQQDIEMLADNKFPYKNRSSLDYVEDAYKLSPNVIRTEVKEEEIIAAVQDIRNKSYTSAEGIKMKVFYKSIEFVANIIGAITEMSFWTSYIPKKARITQGTLIPKKAPGQFRIVHVSSPLAALLELIALRRLEYRLEEYMLNSPYQFGFSAKRSRHDLMARTLEFFYKDYLRLGKKASGQIISLDIEGAFDNVDQDMLISSMDRKFWNDPIKYWLASFVLNRKIRIKSGNLHSSLRNICLGVPQGSALGPVLWNYMIHDLDSGIAIPGKTELLRYADDIILIYRGNDRRDIQRVLDKLVNKLNDIGLNIRPEKCSEMNICLGRRDQRETSYYIKGIPIVKVKKMNILGMPITNKLKLNRQSVEHIQKLNASIKKLHNIARLGLVNLAQEWRILIRSYLESRLITNNWPILLLDHNSCKWVDNTITKSARIIFGWPPNVSTKLIRLITGTLGCREIVIKTAKLRALTEFADIYRFLIRISDQGALSKILAIPFRERLERGMITRGFNLELDIIGHRKHPDPTKLLAIGEAKSFQETLEAHTSTWIILDRNIGSMMAEIDNTREVIQIKLGRHTQYPISYFNSLSLILKTISERTCNSRSLTLSECSSLLSAIENMHNNDWRIIQLRERMIDNGWKVNKIRQSEDIRLKEYLLRKYQSITLRHNMDTTLNDFTLWLAMNERTDEEREMADRRPNHQVEALTEPWLMDYKQRNRINKDAQREEYAYFRDCHTNVTRALTHKIEIWQSLTPNWIEGSRLLVLGGMFNNQQGQLEHGQREPSDTCPLCVGQQDEYNRNVQRMEDGEWHGIDINKIKTNVVLHRTFVCNRFNTNRMEFKRRLGHLSGATTESKSMEDILTGRRDWQRLLSLMVECNMGSE